MKRFIGYGKWGFVLSAVLLLAGCGGSGGGGNEPVPPAAPSALERAEELRAASETAATASAILVGEFALQEGECISVLSDAGYTAVEITEALRDHFARDASEIAATLRERIGLTPGACMGTLRDVGYTVPAMVNAAREGLGIADAREIEALFETLGYPENEFLEVTAFPSIARFAPMLGFDRNPKGLPMSAERYFDNMLSPVVDGAAGTISWAPRGDSRDGPPVDPLLGIVRLCGRDECNRGMSNEDLDPVQSGEVPTYFNVIRQPESGRLRVSYWWYYGFQYPCNLIGVGADGAHHGDWEHIVVTTTPARDAIETVTFFQHSGHYTRKQGGFEVHGERPKVYVGKIAHGAYHDRCKAPECSDAVYSLQCRYYGDFRNPTDTDWWNTSGRSVTSVPGTPVPVVTSAEGTSLVSLRSEQESWLAADAIGSSYEPAGGDYTTTQWTWGPHISYCNLSVLGPCTQWVHRNAVGTHPTAENLLTWDMPHCKDDGCGRSQGWL